MTDILCYDGTFYGLLSVVFECYKSKLNPENITADSKSQYLFVSVKTITTDLNKSDRVQKALKKKVSQEFFQILVTIFTSEVPGIENLLFRVIKKIITSSHSIENNYADKDVHDVLSLNTKFRKEVHRMHAFVRFKKYDDQLYFATIEPTYNMIPFICPFFVDRFADQSWVIYDNKRKKGIFYDKEKVSLLLRSDWSFLENSKMQDDGATVKEETAALALWKTYFSSVNIAERKNLKLQKSHMPKKYWKFLSELSV